MSEAEDRGRGSGYPVYRRMVGTGHLYRIESARRFTELQRVGSRRLRHVVEAAAYPELARIIEMVECVGGAYEIATAEEWELGFAEVS